MEFSARRSILDEYVLLHGLNHRAKNEAAEEQRKLCHDWLLRIMCGSPEKKQTKDAFRAEAIERFKISKGAFERAWTSAITETGNHHWSKPISRAKKMD